MKSNNNYNKNLKPDVNSLRRNPTKSEMVLWKNVLSRGQLNGFKFKRQRTIDKYIVDFFCQDLNLIIELDGMSHINKDNYDDIRQKELENLGYKFLRFYDDYILNNLEDCKIYLYDYVKNLSSPNPLQRGLENFKHILIVGGTGMLAGTVDNLIEKNYKISITGRNKTKLDSFTKNNPRSVHNINLIQSDYTNSVNFLSAIQQSENKFGIIDNAILWIHSNGTDTLIKLIEHLTSTNKNIVIYHIKGSASYKPGAIKIPGIEKFKNEIDYREVFLGFKNENGNSRWLTDKEISDGVIYAFENDLKNYTIGITEPWELHP